MIELGLFMAIVLVTMIAWAAWMFRATHRDPLPARTVEWWDDAGHHSGTYDPGLYALSIDDDGAYVLVPL